MLSAAQAQSLVSMLIGASLGQLWSSQELRGRVTPVTASWWQVGALGSQADGDSSSAGSVLFQPEPRQGGMRSGGTMHRAGVALGNILSS